MDFHGFKWLISFCACSFQISIIMFIFLYRLTGGDNHADQRGKVCLKCFCDTFDSDRCMNSLTRRWMSICSRSMHKPTEISEYTYHNLFHRPNLGCWNFGGASANPAPVIPPTLLTVAYPFMPLQGYTGCPKNNGTVNFQDFALINSYLFSPCWIEHLFLFIITPRSFNLVKKFLFYEYFLMDCHFRALPLSFHWWVAPKKCNSRFFRTLLWSTVIFFYLPG